MKRNLTYVCIILALALAACGPAPVAIPTPQAGATEAPTSSGPVVLHVGWLGLPDTLNPAYAFLVESFTIFDLIYGTLTTQAPTGEYIGNLAKDWSQSADGLTWTFTLKDGIKFHDGTPLTAADVAWTYNAVMKDPEGWAAVSNYVAGFNAVTAPDDHTVVIKTDYPVSNMDYRVSWLYVVYPKDFEGFANAQDLQNFTNFSAIGSGPFKINTFDKDTGVIILDTNPDYYDGRAKIDQVIFQKFDNSDAMIQAIKVGDIDLVIDVPQSAYSTLKDFAGVEPVSTEGSYFDELIINSVPADHSPKPNRNPALEDAQVRLALAQAINKNDLVEVVMQGLGKPATTIIPPTLGGGYWTNTDVQDIPFDLAQANATLEQAGYMMGSDGVRAKGKVHLDFRLQFPSDNPIYARSADMLTEWFKQIGVKTTPESVDPDSLTAQITPTGDYDLVLWGWGPDPDPDFILSVLTSSQFVDGGWSDSGYSNPAYDQLYLDQQAATDKEKRRDIVWKMQKMAFDDRPYIVLYYEDLLRAYRSDRFTGFIVSPIGIESYQSLLKVEAVK